MKSYIVLALTILISSNAFSGTGIGVSVQDSDSRIYIPIDITESFRIEPLARYYKNEDNEGVDVESLNEVFELGAGFFLKSQLVENLDFLYGTRISYASSKRSFRFSQSPDETDLDGYSIAPIIGFEYFIMDKFSIGGEVALVYTSLDGEVNDSGGKEDVDDTSTYTDTSLNLRFYF